MDLMGKVYHENMHLPLHERVGYTLREGAKHIPISFGKQILPYVDFMSHDDTHMGFNFFDGLYYPYEVIDGVYYVHNKENDYTRETAPEHRTPLGLTLDLAGAMWGGNWQGHSNPDFGMVVNLGTDGIREKIANCAKEHPEADAFYRGCTYVMDALDILGDRFYKLACEMAASCEDITDKKRYELAAKAFEVIPRKPAYDFTSACHAFCRFLQLRSLRYPEPQTVRPYQLQRWHLSNRMSLSAPWLLLCLLPEYRDLPEPCRPVSLFSLSRWH